MSGTVEMLVATAVELDALRMGFGLVFAGLANGTGRIRTVRSVGATGVPDLARRAARAELRTGRVVVATREFFGGDIFDSGPPQLRLGRCNRQSGFPPSRRISPRYRSLAPIPPPGSPLE